MKIRVRRTLLLLLVLLSMLASSLLGTAALAEETLMPESGRCVFKIADQRVGLASSAQGNAENYMVVHASTESTPLCTVDGGVSFRLYNLYEAVFFPGGSGQARFTLEVFHRTTGGDVLIASQTKTELGFGPRRAVGAVSVPVVLTEPGLYRLAIVATALSDPSSGPEARDRDEIVVWVLVRDNGRPTRTPTPTRTPPSPIEVRPAEPVAGDPGSSKGDDPTLGENPPSEIAPTDSRLRVAYPRGHFLSNSVAAVENFDQGHGSVLTVRQGHSITFESAYEFVWFAGASGSGSTSLSIRYEEAKTGDGPLGEDSRDCQNGLKMAGTLRAPVTFTEAGTFVVVATIDSRVNAGGGLQVVTHDRDQVRITVHVIGEPETGAISGYVSEDVNDVPLERAQVRVYEAESGRIAATVYTNESGRYVATGLKPGKYLLHADAIGQNYLPEWYDDVPSREDATPVEVVANLTLIGIDFGLTEGAIISGQVIEESVITGAVIVPIPGTAITIGPLGENRAIGKGITGNDGRYKVDRLPAGSYWVHAANERAYCLPEYWDDKPTLDTADEVVAVSGKETENINFRLQYGGSISGVVRPLRSDLAEAADPADATGVRPFAFRVTAYEWESNEAVKTVSVGIGGRYHLTSLPVGRYAIYAFDPDNQYLPEYYDDVRVIEEATPVPVEKGRETKGIDFDLDWAGVPLVEVLPSAQSVMQGDLFTVTLMVRNVQNLGSFDLQLRFDPSIAAAQSAELGDFLASTGRDVSPVGPVIDNQAGTLTFGAFSVGDEPGPDGDGVLATVLMQAIGEGESLLALNNVQLLDTESQLIPNKTRDGTVRVGGCIFGDFDCDCDVDMLDVMQVALRWGTVEGDPDYDPTYDLDHDGDIDIVDVSIVAAAYGNTCDSGVSGASLDGARGLQANLTATGMRLAPSVAEVQLGSEQMVEVWIDDALDLAMFEFTLQYDASRLSLDAEDVALGGFLSSTGRSVFPLSPVIFEQGGIGTVSFGAATLGSQPAGPSGSGVLVELTFSPLQVGEAELDLAEGQWTDTKGNAMEEMALGNGALTITGYETTMSTFVPLITRQ